MPEEAVRKTDAVDDGLARLRAESRRFQDELRCISSSLSCPPPPQGRGHGDPSSASSVVADDQSSDNSVWDSPHALRQIVTRARTLPGSVSLSHASVQAGTGGGGNGNGQDSEQEASPCPRPYCEYSVDSPVSVQQASAATALEYDSGQEKATEIARRDGSTFMQSRVNDELIAPAGITKEACGRITATTIFTANGGRLVLRSPSPSILQGSIMPSGEVAIESAWSQDTRPQGHAVEWKRSTTLTIRNDSSHVCTGSVTICEENTSAQTKDASVSTSTCSPDESAIKDPNQMNGINGTPIYHTQISLENFTRKANVDESDSNKFPRPGSSTNLMKLKNAAASVGKDNVLARRMATRIKFMLQTLDSNKKTGHDQLCYRTFNQGINSKKYHDPAHRLRHSENLAQKRISKVEGIPDPESYLEDVVLALSSSAYASHADDFNQGERLTVDGEGQEVIHKAQAQPAKLDSPPESSMEKGKGENTDPNGMRGYVSGIQPGKLFEYSTDSGKPQEILSQHSRTSDRAGEAVEYCVETGSMFAKNDGGNVISNRSIVDNPNTAFLQDCRKKVCHLLEGNLLLEKQRRMAGAMHKVEGNIANEQEFQTLQSTFHERMGTDGDGLNMTEHLETKVPSSQGINHLDGHVSLTLKPDSGDSEKQLISTVRRDSRLKIKSPRSSVLDSAVDAAIHAANDLAKNLAHGITSDVATTRAEQVTDSLLQRTKSATKAVQVLLGEKFDYGSMYQDLKMLEVERRKLEGRAKTTVQFQTNSTAAGRLLKQDKLYDQQLLRRKAEAGDGSLSVSDAKRRRTTKSPNHGGVPRSTGWKHERTEMKQVFPTYMSSLGITMANHWNEGGKHRFPMTMVKESKRKPIHTRIQTQVKTKVRVQRPKGSYQGPQNIDVKKKSRTPPHWVERMTRGRPSHDIHEIQIKDAIGASTTKNFVVRRSVRPPGSIFKTSNLIQWTSKTTCIQDAKPQKRNKGKLKSPEDIKAQPKVPNKPVFEMGASSKSVQNLNIIDESEKITENKGNSNNSIITFSEEKKEESKKPRRTEMITNVQSPDDDVLGNYETAPKDLDAKKSFVESLLRDIAEQSRKEHTKNEKSQQEELAVSGMLTEEITDESAPVENADDYRRQFEDEITQGSLLAMALQSILNDQSSDDNESRGLIRPNDRDPNNCKDLEPAQQCKSVQTTEINSGAPASVYAPFPLLPTYHLPDGNTHPTPPLFYIPCTPGNFPCTTSEQVNLSTTRSHRHGKKPLSWRNTHKYSDCSRYVSVKQQESSSSVTTPSSPASIHEVEDLCETGWNHPNESVFPFKTDTNHQDMEKINKEEESLEKRMGNRNDEIIESKKREPVVPELPRYQGGRVSGEEELQITRRSPFTPSGDRINSSVQNWVKETVSRLEIPFTALVSQQKVSAPSYSSIIVPSWAEIKRPMRKSSSSQNSSSSTDELSSFSTNSSFSIGELQQKAFAILRDSLSTSLVSLGEVGNTAQVQCDDISEGEVDTVDRADDLVELGEVMLERLPIQVDDSASSEGASKLELGEIVS